MFGMGLFEMVLLVGAFCVPLVVATALALRFVRANEQRTREPGGSRALEERVARLEAELEQMSFELQRLADSQRHATRTLTERDGGAQAD